MIVTLFQGADGWGEGLRMLDLHREAVGFELDRWACATARAAGHRAVRADLEGYPTGHLRDVDGLIASPPCPAFSAAGLGEGRAVLDDLTASAAEGRLRPDLPPAVRLVLEPSRWIRDCRPMWVAMEQVPPVLPVWEGYARWLRGLGYSVWCGILNAADYGVPQTRRRAFLIASRARVVAPPEPTHAQHPTPTLFGGEPAPWVTMADALGWSGVVDRQTVSRGPAGTRVKTVGVPASRPAPTLCQPEKWRLRGSSTANATVRDATEPAPTLLGNIAKQGGWCWERPATTVVGSFSPDTIAAPGWRGPGDGPRQNAPGSVSVSVSEALVLQSFRPDYPVQGPKSAQFLQVGNAVPPLLAAAVLTAAVGVPVGATS